MTTASVLAIQTLGWNASFGQGADTHTYTFSGLAPGPNCELLLGFCGILNGDHPFTETNTTNPTSTGSTTSVNPTWVVQAESNPGVHYSAAGAGYTAHITTDPGTFTVSFILDTKYDIGNNIDAGAYFAVILKLTDIDPTTPWGGKVATAGNPGDGAVTVTLDAAPATGDDTYLFSITDCDSGTGATQTLGAGTWTTIRSGVNVNGSGSSAGDQLCFILAKRTGSTSASVPIADVQLSTGNYSSGQFAIVAKTAASGQTWTGSSATMLMTGTAASAPGAGTGTVSWVTAGAGTMLMSGTTGSFLIGLTWAGSSATMLMTGTAATAVGVGAGTGTWTSTGATEYTGTTSELPPPLPKGWPTRAPPATACWA
jgi:hypothetical protein